MSTLLARAPLTVHVSVAMIAGLLFPLAGIAAAIGRLDERTFVGVAAFSLATFGLATEALYRRPIRRSDRDRDRDGVGARRARRRTRRERARSRPRRRSLRR